MNRDHRPSGRARRRQRWSRPDQPVTALIVPAACGGFLLLIVTDQGAHVPAGPDLGTRTGDYGWTPNPAEVARADDALTELGLNRSGPWAPPADRPGPLTAALSWPCSSTPPQTQARARVWNLLTRLLRRGGASLDHP